MLAKWNLRSDETNTLRRVVYHGRTNDLVQLLAVVQDQGVNLSIGRFFGNVLVLGKTSGFIMQDAQNCVTCCASDNCWIVLSIPS